MQKNSKKIKKKPLGLLFKIKLVRKGRERGKMQIIVSLRFVPTQCVIENSKQIAKKFKKLEEYHCGFIWRKNRLRTAQKERKQKLLFRSVPTRHIIENSKKIEKKFRKFKNNIVASFQAIIGWKRPRNRENKNYHSVLFQPDAL